MRKKIAILFMLAAAVFIFRSLAVSAQEKEKKRLEKTLRVRS